MVFLGHCLTEETPHFSTFSQNYIRSSKGQTYLRKYLQRF